MSGTFSDQPPQVGPGTVPQVEASPRRPRRPYGGLTLTGVYEVAGRPALLAGLMLVLLARGCDTVSERSVGRAESKLALAKNAFDDQWQLKGDKVQVQIEETKDKLSKEREKTAADRSQDRINSLQKDLEDLDHERQELNDDEAKERAELDRTAWRKLSNNARDAKARSQINAYWWEILFVLGTLVLAFGLLAVSWTGTGPERWVCLIMLAILTLSMYVYGFAWK
jgi:F0F1-type ATP synthase assembly protein I